MQTKRKTHNKPYLINNSQMSPLTIRISITLCIILVLTNPSTSLAPRPQRNDASIADAIRYLNELDSVYSKASKSR